MSEPRLRRAAVVRVIDAADRTVVVEPSGHAHELSGASAELARALLAFLVTPRTREAVLAHVEALTGAPLPSTSVIDELLALLTRAQAVTAAPSPEPARPLAGCRVVVGLTGAIAAMHAPTLITQLLARGAEVRVAATVSARRFVSLDALEALTHASVVVELHAGTPEEPVPHLALARWADLVLVWPAAASTLSRLAAGDYGSVVSAVALGATCPVIVVPSMNAGMFIGAAVQRNVAALVADGFHVVQPAFGAEVADAPEERVKTLGPAPPPRVVVELTEAVLALSRRGRPFRPDTGPEWDAVYRRHPPTALPWHREEADLDVLEAALRHGDGALSVLDVGTGLGQVARELAARGHRVVATDIAPSALDAARRVASTVVWLEDDITQSRLRGDFDVVIDRGCLHVLPPSRASDWARAMARLTRPLGRLVVKLHEPAASAQAGTVPYEVDAVVALLGEAFELIDAQASTFPGPRAAPPARLLSLRRVV